MLFHIQKFTSCHKCFSIPNEIHCNWRFVIIIQYKSEERKRKFTYFWSTSIWMGFLFKRDGGDHVPFCFIIVWTVCSSRGFFFGHWSPLYHRTGILSKDSNHQKKHRTRFPDSTSRRKSTFIFTDEKNFW